LGLIEAFATDEGCLSEGRGLKPMPGPERAQRRLSESDGKDSVGEAG
jgi:hypothetical protein